MAQNNLSQAEFLIWGRVRSTLLPSVKRLPYVLFPCTYMSFCLSQHLVSCFIVRRSRCPVLCIITPEYTADTTTPLVVALAGCTSMHVMGSPLLALHRPSHPTLLGGGGVKQILRTF